MPISKHTEQLLVEGLRSLAHGQISGFEVNAEATQNRAERRLLEHTVQLQQLLHDIVVQCESLGRGSLELKLEARSPGDEVHAAFARLVGRFQKLTTHVPQPTDPSALAPSATETATSLGPAPSDAHTQERPVLIIEANALVAASLLNQAQEQGFTGVVTSLGLEGLRLAEALRPRLILLGLELQDSEGSKILEQLKFNLETRPIPVYIISDTRPAPHVLTLGPVGSVNRTEPGEQRTFFEKLRERERGNRRVLVVEDNRLTQRILRRLIARDRVELEVLGTGGEALQAVTEQRFDCVLLDLDLPDMTGFEFLRLMAKLPAELRPPVVIYTGTELTQGQRRELSAHAANIVLKGPESPERLMDAISLFLHCQPDDLPPSQRAVIHALHDPRKLLQGRTVLVVDNDDASIDGLSELLLRAGMSVLSSRNAVDALDQLEARNDVDVIIMDLGLPGTDGLEATRQIRMLPRNAEVPIIAVTSNPMRYDRERCLLAGANDFMTKPIGTDQLLALLRMWLYRAA